MSAHITATDTDATIVRLIDFAIELENAASMIRSALGGSETAVAWLRDQTAAHHLFFATETPDWDELGVTDEG